MGLSLQESLDAKVRGPLAGTIVDQQLVLDEDGLGNNRAQASWTKEAEKRRDETDKDDDLAHHGIINNMAKSVKLRPKQQFASDTVKVETESTHHLTVETRSGCLLNQDSNTATTVDG